jgi:hypothetical protein
MTTKTKTTMFPALRVLEKSTPPLRFGLPPYWHAPVTPASAKTLIPSWNWRSIHEIPEGEKALTLDSNGAYLAAAGSVKIAHSQLEHTGAMPCNPSPNDVAPGYYLVVVPHWAFSGTIVSPLGDAITGRGRTEAWVAAPTLTLLLELERDGALGEVTIADSYTATRVTDLRAWVARLRTIRTDLLDRRQAAQTEAARAACQQDYDQFKLGYSAALSMMLTGEKTAVRRPDWTHTVHAQHRASIWRKAWRFTATGRPLLAMGSTDTITVLEQDAMEAIASAKPPFRIDTTGRTLGHLKPTDTPAPLPRRDAPAALIPEGEDPF